MLQSWPGISPDSGEDLCDKCFSSCLDVLHVRFGKSSLKVIGIHAFFWSGLKEVHVLDSVEGVCEGCFSGCDKLSRVSLRDSTTLKWLNADAFDTVVQRAEIECANWIK